MDRAAEINALRYVGTPTNTATLSVSEQACVARDNYLRSAQNHRRLAEREPAYSEQWHAHRRLAASFNLKAETLSVVAADAYTPRRVVTL